MSHSTRRSLRHTVFTAATTLASVTGLTAAATAPRSPALEHGTVTLSTGIRMHYVAKGNHDGVPVIFLHGYSDTWYSYSAQLERLSPRIRAYVLDQRGHGDTDKPAAHYTMPDLARDVLAFMDAQGIRAATVVGHSLGSFVAQQVVAIAPERVSGLVLMSAATHARQFIGIEELGAAVATLSDPVPLEFTTEFQKSTILAPVDAAFVARVSEDSRRLPAEAWRQLYRGMMEMEVIRPRVADRLPTLLLWGERDVLVPASAQAELLSIWTRARLVALAETNHAPHWERPDRITAELHAFLLP